MTLHPPKPPPEKFGPEGYALYLKAYETYAEACVVLGKETAKADKVRSYSQVAKGQVEKPAPPLAKDKKTPKVKSGEIPARNIGVGAGKPPPLPPRKGAKAPTGGAGSKGLDSGDAATGGRHARNLRKQRRVLVTKVTGKLASLRGDSPESISQFSKETFARLWENHGRFVPGAVLPAMFGALKKGEFQAVEQSLMSVTERSVDRGGIWVEDGALRIAPKFPRPVPEVPVGGGASGGGAASSVPRPVPPPPSTSGPQFWEAAPVPSSSTEAPRSGTGSFMKFGRKSSKK